MMHRTNPRRKWLLMSARRALAPAPPVRVRLCIVRVRDVEVLVQDRRDEANRWALLLLSSCSEDGLGPWSWRMKVKVGAVSGA